MYTIIKFSLCSEETCISTLGNSTKELKYLVIKRLYYRMLVNIKTSIN